ncbi:hypothetical protein [Rhodovulum adriaticum]|uniref:Uncharacterized protein n=1 Tax=Rhodovulum adriaticum TaxID=35804 RepID=A0A4R2P1T7_RHOAD|nr:hypothetical protein [Rhodovulum adriaticum]TCP27635.1 hypothetical protein EV656_101544 [Rhodovulum adriaticum]
MPYRHWLSSIAIGLGLTASAATGQHTSNEHGEAQRAEAGTAEQSDQAEPFSLPVQIIESEEAAETRKRGETIDRKLQERDLVAQEGMNRATQSIEQATWWLLWVSALSVGFVGVGTGLLVWTLRLTRQANEAAQAAVAVTREIGKKQVRAYVGTTSTGFEKLSDDCILLSVGIHNSGLSPAFDLGVISEAFFASYPLPDERPMPTSHHGFRTTLSPGAEVTTSQRLRGDVEGALLEIRRGAACAAYIQGRVVYRDVFDEWHETRFRFAYGGRLAGVGPHFHACESGNSSD